VAALAFNRPHRFNERSIMSSQFDEVKGRVKEAAGDLTDNDELKREGKADQAGSKAKKVAEDVKEAIDEGIDALKEKVAKDDS
jgi:uncharacterized protein YjbJ (UPF0337 family)